MSKGRFEENLKRLCILCVLVFLGEDRHRLAKNFYDLVDTIETIANIEDTDHFLDIWSEDYEHEVLLARSHIDDCAACRAVFNLIKSDTSLDFVPVIFDDEITVTTAKRSKYERNRREANIRNVVHE